MRQVLLLLSFYRSGSMISEIRNWAKSNKLLGIELLAEHLVFQLLSCVWLLAIPWTAARQAFLSFTIPWSLLRLMSLESVMPSNHLILSHPLLLLPSTFPSISLFWWVGSSHQVAKILELQHQSFQWIFRIDFFKDWIDWFDLLAVQGTLKNLLQCHSSKESIPQHSAFFMVQLSHPYMTTGKTIALTIWTFVGKVMSLLLICCLGLS